MTTARAILDGHTTEEQLQRAIIDLARYLGLEAYHTYDSRRSERGFPDLVLVGPRGIVFAELKTMIGSMRPDQTRWRNAIVAAGGEFHVWRPVQWSDGTVENVLRGIA